ncbi:hypothetical protein GN956_G3557 [Arapaima gigas]
MDMITETALLLVLLLHPAQAFKEPESIFRAEGGEIEMGFCFGADYIVVYKQSPNGDLLLGNSSELPEPSQSLPASVRRRVTITTHIVGLLGLEFKSLEPSDSGVYRRECWENGQLGKQKDLTDQVQVHNNGSVLHISSSFLKYNHDIYCLVLEGETCISYRSMSLPEPGKTEVQTVVHSHGEDITLSCSSKLLNPELLFWDTPFGLIDWTSSLAATQATHTNGIEQLKKEYRFERKNFALIIPSVSEKYSGQYKCFSPLLVKEYSLIVCPKMDPVEVPFSLGDGAILSCDPNVKEPYSVQWYRRNNLETDDLVLDTKDPRSRIPENLKGKLSVSQLDSSLMLHNLTAEDKGEYWCVALVDVDFLDNFGDYEDLLGTDYVAQCVLSQRTRLVPLEQGDTPSSSIMVYVVLAVVAGVVLLVVLCGILAVQLMRRRRASQGCRYVSKRPGQHSSEGGPGDDVTCTERLDPTVLSL